MPALLETVVDPIGQADVLRRRRHGVIEMAGGRLVAIHLRPWPRRGSLLEARTLGRLWHRYTTGDRALLYYSQPWGSANYLALRYCQSTRDCRLATFHGTVRVLEEIARIKGSDAILADVSSGRISDRLLARWGWEPLGGGSRGRTFVRRFYGAYPEPAFAELLAC